MSVRIPSSLLKLGTFEFKITVSDLPSRTKTKFLREVNTGIVLGYGEMSKLALALRKSRGMPSVHFSGGRYPALRWFSLPRESTVWAELDKLPAIVALSDDRKKESYRREYQGKEERLLAERTPTTGCSWLALGAMELYRHMAKHNLGHANISESSVITLDRSYF